MKTLLTIALLAVATVCLSQPSSTNYLITLIQADIKHPDKVVEKADEITAFGDNSNGVPWEARTLCQSQVDTSRWYRMVCYAVEIEGGVDKKLTVAGVTIKLKKNLSAKSKNKIIVIAGGMKPSKDLEDWLKGEYYE